MSTPGPTNVSKLKRRLSRGASIVAQGKKVNDQLVADANRADDEMLVSITDPNAVAAAQPTAIPDLDDEGYASTEDLIDVVDDTDDENENEFDDDEELAALLQRDPVSQAQPTAGQTTTADAARNAVLESVAASPNPAVLASIQPGTNASVLTSTSTATPKTRPKTRTKADLDAMMDDNLYASYQNSFGTQSNQSNMFKVLAKALRESNVDSAFHGQTYNFVAQLEKVMPVFELAYVGAQKDVLNTANGSDDEKKQADTRLVATKILHDKLKSLQSLANNQIRYTDAQFDETCAEIEQALTDAGVSDDVKDELLSEFENVVGPQRYAYEDKPEGREWYQTKQFLGGFGSTPFEAGNNPEKELKKYKKRNQMNIMDEGKAPDQKITVRLNYPRQSVLGSTFGSSEKGRAALEKEMDDFVNVILTEYKPPKGSQDNPINIHYIPPDVDRSDEALAFLMKMKEKAIETGETFYMKDPKNPTGPLVEITPKPGFDAAERAAFMHFAKSTPQSKSSWGLGEQKAKDANACAAYKLFKEDKDDAGNRILTKGQHARIPDSKIEEVMENRLKQADDKFKKEAKQRLGAAMNDVPSVKAKSSATIV